MEKYLNLIRKSKLFYGINEEETKSMLKCLSAEEKSYKKGEYVFRVFDNIPAVALLLYGTIHIQKEDFWGNLSLLAEIVPGQLFGETYACIQNEPISVNAVAIRDSLVLMLDIKRVLTFCSSSCAFHTRLIQNLISVIAMKNVVLTSKIEHMSQRTTRDKLLSYLSEQSVLNQSSSFDISLNRQQLSDYLSVDRSAMSNELCKLRDEGLLFFSKNHFELKDLAVHQP